MMAGWAGLGGGGHGGGHERGRGHARKALVVHSHTCVSIEYESSTMNVAALPPERIRMAALFLVLLI